MPLVIPTFPSVALYVERVRLSGRDFLLTFDWNGREARWYLSIATAEGVPIVSGIKLVCNWPLLRTNVSAERPAGELFCLSAEKSTEPPGFADLGVRVRLLYYELSELA